MTDDLSTSSTLPQGADDKPPAPDDVLAAVDVIGEDDTERFMPPEMRPTRPLNLPAREDDDEIEGWVRRRRTDEQSLTVPMTFGRWLAGLFGQDVNKVYRQRLANLNKAISLHPDSSANYLQRGELYLEVRQYGKAATDFRRAIELAEAEYELRAWGLLAQTVRDRALDGLAKAARKLEGNNSL